MFIVSTHEVPGHKTQAYVGLVWAAVVRSRHVGHDLYALLKSIRGGDLHSYEHLTNQGRADVLKKLEDAARQKGANAIVGLRFGTTQILPTTIEVYAYGTAVKVKKA